jgi:hypothetical protein
MTGSIWRSWLCGACRDDRGEGEGGQRGNVWNTSRQASASTRAKCPAARSTPTSPWPRPWPQAERMPVGASSPPLAHSGSTSSRRLRSRTTWYAAPARLRCGQSWSVQTSAPMWRRWAATPVLKRGPVHVVPLHNPVTGPAFARQSFHLGYSPPVRPSEGGVIVDPAGDSTVVLAADLFEVFCSHPDVDALPQDLFADEPRDVSAPSPVLVLSPGQEEAYLPRP